jgi:hypothetical protein
VKPRFTLSKGRPAAFRLVPRNMTDDMFHVKHTPRLPHEATRWVVADLLTQQGCRLCVIDRARLQRPVVTPTPSRRDPGEGIPASPCMTSAGGAVYFRWRPEGHTKRCRGRGCAPTSERRLCRASVAESTSGRRTAPLRHPALPTPTRVERPKVIRCCEAAPSTFEDASDRQTLATPPLETPRSPKGGLMPRPRGWHRTNLGRRRTRPTDRRWVAANEREGRRSRTDHPSRRRSTLSTPLDIDRADRDQLHQDDLHHSPSSRSSAEKPSSSTVRDRQRFHVKHRDMSRAFALPPARGSGAFGMRPGPGITPHPRPAHTPRRRNP